MPCFYIGRQKPQGYFLLYIKAKLPEFLERMAYCYDK